VRRDRAADAVSTATANARAAMTMTFDNVAPPSWLTTEGERPAVTPNPEFDKRTPHSSGNSVVMPPATAPKILQNAVSQLRRALGDDRVETRAPGYLFRLGPQLQQLEREILTQDPKLASDRPRAHVIAVARRRILALGALALALSAALAFGLIHVFGNRSSTVLARADSLVAIDPAGNKIVDAVDLASTPRGVAVGRTGVWVADALDNTVSWFAPETLELKRTIGIGAPGYAVAVGGSRVWVATGSDNSVVEIDERTGGILATIPLPNESGLAEAWAIVFAAGSVWVTSDNRLLQIDPRTSSIVAGDVGPPCCFRPTGLAYGERSLWLADGTKLRRASASTDRITGEAQLDDILDAVAVGLGKVWGTTRNAQQQDPALLYFDRQALVSLDTPLPRSLIVMHSPLTVAVGGGAVWVADYGQQRIVRFDPETVTFTVIRLPGSPWGLAFADNRLLVTLD
jgi:DNA-binding beta-propeller fold protein YncE